MKVQFVNNAGRGFADAVEVEGGTTIAKFFRDRLGSNASPGDYTIRVNGRKVVSSTLLNEMDHVEITKPDGTAPAPVEIPSNMVDGQSILNDGDRVTVTQNKIEGGTAAC